MFDMFYNTTPFIMARAKKLRRNMTPAEMKLWNSLKDRNIFKCKWRRQHPLHLFIVDFYCHELKLVIELDGPIHSEQIEEDKERTDWLSKWGIEVHRFTNQQIFSELENVIENILDFSEIRSRDF